MPNFHEGSQVARLLKGRVTGVRQALSQELSEHQGLRT